MKKSLDTAFKAFVVAFVVGQVWAPVTAWAFKAPTTGSVTITAGTGLSGAGTTASPLAGVAASSSVQGDVTTGAQTFAGAKTFSGSTNFSAASCMAVSQPLRFNASAACTTGPYIYATNADVIKLGSGNGGEVWFDQNGLFPSTDNTRLLGQGGLRWTNGFFAGSVTLGDITGDTTVRGTCTLDGATPSVCTATVTASAICTCSNVGASAAIAALGCAVGVSGTTLTITSAAAATHNVNYHCIL